MSSKQRLEEDVKVVQWDLNHLTADKIYFYLIRMFPDDDIEYIRHMGIIINHTQGRAEIAPTIEEMRDIIEFEKTEEDTTELDQILIKIWEDEHPET